MRVPKDTKFTANPDVAGLCTPVGGRTSTSAPARTDRSLLRTGKGIFNKAIAKNLYNAQLLLANYRS